MTEDEGLTLATLDQLRREAAKAASDQVRTLALAGLAIVWLFTGPFFTRGTADRPDWTLFLAAAALALALTLDFAQLATRALMMDYAYSKVEERPDVQEALAAGREPIVDDIGIGLRWITFSFFVAKTAALGSGYLVVFGYFVFRIAN